MEPLDIFLSGEPLHTKSSISVAPNKRTRSTTPTNEEEDQPPKKETASKKAVGRPIATSQRGGEEDGVEGEAKVKTKTLLRIR